MSSRDRTRRWRARRARGQRVVPLVVGAVHEDALAAAGLLALEHADDPAEIAGAAQSLFDAFAARVTRHDAC